MSMRGESHQVPEKVSVLPCVFECVVMGHPSSPAIKDAHNHQTWTTYHQLNQSVNKLARCIVKRLDKSECHNPEGDRVVAVCISPSSQLVTALLAILKAGAAYLPLDVTFPESHVAHILQDARPALLLAHGEPAALQGAHTSPQLENNVPILHLEHLHSEVEEERGDNLSVAEVGVIVSGSSIATILYTSGSTGIPKGVRLSHRAILNRLSWQWKTFPYQTQEVCCFKTALTFVDSINEIFGPLLTGHQVVVITKSITQDVEQLVEVLQQEKVGRLTLVPSLLRSIILHCAAVAAQQHTSSLPALRLWVCSGEVFPTHLLHSFFNTFTHGQTICNFYGSTEVMGDVTYLEMCNTDDALAKIIDNKVPIGLPISNCRIYLLNSAGEAVLEGEVGEVCVAGLSLASGYVGAALQHKFITNKFTEDTNYSVLFRTGDLGRIVDSVLVLEGREDSQIKIRGHRVDINEVELSMLKVDHIDKVHVMCYMPGEVNQALVGFYTSSNTSSSNTSSSSNSQDDNLVPEKLREKLCSLLQPHMIPQLIQMNELPLLVNGKVDGQQLLKVYEQRQDEREVEVDVSGVSEEEAGVARTLLLTVARVLGPQIARSQHLSLNTSFFDIGGNSLNSVMVVTSLIDMGYSIGISQFMKAKTLGEVVTKLRRVSLQEEDISDMCRQAGDTDQYTCHMLDHHHKDAVMAMISESFCKRGELEMCVHTQPWEYVHLLNALYDQMLLKQLSYVLTREGSEEVVACSLNFDLHDEPPLPHLSPVLGYIMTFLDHLKKLSKCELPKEVGRVFHSGMMATLYDLTPLNKVQLIQIMERENLKLAQVKGFKVVFTTNTSSLTQQMCQDILGYRVLHNLQANLYVAPDGSKPFAAAPSSQRVISSVKFI